MLKGMAKRITPDVAQRYSTRTGAGSKQRVNYDKLGDVPKKVRPVLQQQRLERAPRNPGRIGLIQAEPPIDSTETLLESRTPRSN